MEHNTLEFLIKLGLTIAVLWLLVELDITRKSIRSWRIKDAFRKSEYSLVLFSGIRIVAATIEYIFDLQVGWFSIAGTLLFFMMQALVTRFGRQKFIADWAAVEDKRPGGVFTEGITLAEKTTKELSKLQ